jgi:hypothetical protein
MVGPKFSRVLKHRHKPSKNANPDFWTKFGVIVSAIATAFAAGALGISVYQTDIMSKQLTIQDSNSAFVALQQRLNAVCAQEQIEMLTWPKFKSTLRKTLERDKKAVLLPGADEVFRPVVQAIRLLQITAREDQEADLNQLLIYIAEATVGLTYPRDAQKKLFDEAGIRVSIICVGVRMSLLDWYKRGESLKIAERHEAFLRRADKT